MERNTSLLKCSSHEMGLLPIYCEDCECPVCNTKCITGSHMKHNLLDVSTYVARQKASMTEECSKLEKVRSELSQMKINTEKRKNQVLEEISRREDAMIGEVKDISADYRSIVGEAALQHTQKIEQHESALHNIPKISELKLETEADCIELVHCRSELRRIEKEIREYDLVHITFEAMTDNRKTQLEKIFGTVCVDNEVNQSSDEDKLIEKKKPLHSSNIEDILKVTKTKLDKNNQTICTQYDLSVHGIYVGINGCKGIFLSAENLYIHVDNELYLIAKEREVRKVLPNVQCCCNLSSENGLLVITRNGRELGYFLRNGNYISLYNGGGRIADVHESDKMGIFMLLVKPFKESEVSVWQFKITGKSNKVHQQDLGKNMSDSKICMLNDTRLMMFKIQDKFLYAFTCGKQQIFCNFKYSGCGANNASFSASSMCVDSDNNILVSDSSDNTIHMLDINGNFLKIIVWPEDNVLNVKRLSVDKEGRLWITQGATNRPPKPSDFCVYDYEYLKKTERTERALTEREETPETQK